MEPETITIPREDYEYLVGTLMDCINQACYVSNNTFKDDNLKSKEHLLDSYAISSYASSLRYLAKIGKVRILNEYGRRVIAEWI